MKRMAVLALVLALLLSGCGNSGEYVPTGDGLAGEEYSQPNVSLTQQRNFSLAYDPDQGLNPYTCSDYTNRTLMSLLYQGLFTVDESYNVEPILCKRYTVSQDMRTYVFYLEEEATFSDGTQVTATDVLFSLDAARGSDIYSGRLTNVQKINITGDGGVQILLSTAYENLPLLLNIPIVPASQVEEHYPIGSGPYYLSPTATGYQLVLRDEWWCSADLPVNAQRISLVEATTAREIRDEFEMGDVGVTCTNPASDSYVDYRTDYDLWGCESGVFLYLHPRYKSNVFNNATVRQALTYAIDRQTIVNTYYNTFGLATSIPASPNFPYYNQALADQYDYDPEKFQEAVITEGMEGKSVVLLVNSADNRRVQVAYAIAEMLEACSLSVTVHAYSGSNYDLALYYGSYDLHLAATVLSPNMDLSAFYESGGALNKGGMTNSTIASLCKNALADSDYYDDLYQAVMEDGMLCSIAFLTYAVYVQADLIEDLSPARDCIFYYSLGKSLSDAKS